MPRNEPAKIKLGLKRSSVEHDKRTDRDSDLPPDVVPNSCLSTIELNLPLQPEYSFFRLNLLFEGRSEGTIDSDTRNNADLRGSFSSFSDSCRFGNQCPVCFGCKRSRAREGDRPIFTGQKQLGAALLDLKSKFFAVKMRQSPARERLRFGFPVEGPPGLLGKMPERNGGLLRQL